MKYLKIGAWREGRARVLGTRGLGSIPNAPTNFSNDVRKVTDDRPYKPRYGN